MQTGWRLFSLSWRGRESPREAHRSPNVIPASPLGALDTFLRLLGTSRKVAVLGNWEYWSGVDLETLRTLYEKRHNTSLLINQTVTFQFDEPPLQVIGLDDFTAGKPSCRFVDRRPGRRRVHCRPTLARLVLHPRGQRNRSLVRALPVRSHARRTGDDFRIRNLVLPTGLTEPPVIGSNGAS